MRKPKSAIILGIVVIILLVTGACSPKRQTTPQPTAMTNQSSGGGVQATESQGGSEGTTVEPAPQQSGVPEDVPIMEGAYKLQTARGGANIDYQIDTDIQSVVQFYQDQLPGSGWDMAGPPDNVVGSIATMLRENEAGDRMTLNMQANEIGGFVIVTISIVRHQ